MADNLKDLNRQLSNAKNELANYQGALDKLRASYKNAKKGTPRFQSIQAQLDRAIADVRNAETRVRALEDSVKTASSAPENKKQKLEADLQRARDTYDSAAIKKAQDALDAFNASTSAQQQADTAAAEAKAAKDKADAEAKAKADAAAKAKTAGGKPTGPTGPVGGGDSKGGSGPTGVVSKEQKTADAIAEAIKLYQMPDIIFNNVPELGALLDKYLDPKSGITLNQFLKEVSNSTWYRQNSSEIKSRYLQKFNYDDLKKRGLAKGDTQYEQDIKSITDQVIAEGRRLGAPVDPTQAQLIAEDLYIHNMDKDAAALTKRLAGSIRMQPLGITGAKGYTGKAQADYQKLLALAKDNGLDLNVILPARVSGATKDETLNNVLAGLSDGSLDISAIQQTARMMAAQGQPQYVKDLLAQGYDLAQIYSPYKKIMSTVLELSPDQIDLNDPTLRSAITNQGDMNTYDFQKSLRKDPRWQYTQNAKQTVSDSVLGVLKDFGFQG